MGDITVAEIGVWKGSHARILQEQLDIDKMYLIDPYDVYEEYQDELDAETMRSAEREAHEKLEAYDNIRWIKDYSETALEHIDDELEYVYIDGNHEYKYVKKDIEKYYEIVKPGGVVAGHDFNPNWPGVMRAVTEFAEEKDTEYHVENRGWDWYIIK